MGYLVRVPKKLEIGMAVVVWIRPHIKLFTSEFNAGIRVGTWFKAKLVTSLDPEGIQIEFNRYRMGIDGSLAIVIRSVSLDDNPAQIKRRKAMKARYRQEVLGKHNK